MLRPSYESHQEGRFYFNLAYRPSPPIHEKNPQADHGKAHHERDGEFLVEHEGAEDDSEDWGKEGEGREPAYRIVVYQLKPYEVADKGNDDRLIKTAED